MLTCACYWLKTIADSEQRGFLVVLLKGEKNQAFKGLYLRPSAESQAVSYLFSIAQAVSGES